MAATVTTREEQPMPDVQILERLVSEVGRQVRFRRAEYYGLRGLLWGALASLLPLLAKEYLGPLALPIAGALLLLGGLVGAVWGAVLTVPAGEAARLADRAHGLKDRVATALEWSRRPDRTPVVDALLADAEARVRAVSAKRAVARRWPREARLLPVPLGAAVVLAVAPPIPLPEASLPNFSVAREDDEDKPKERAGELQTSDRQKATRRDPVQRAEMQDRMAIPRAGGGGSSQQGDLSAVFKDTALSGKAPDFNSFLKQGDDRIRMLGQADRLPDLQSDFTGSQRKIVFQKAKALRGGMNPNQVSPEKLKELLQEMERLGRRGGQGSGGWGGDVFEGMEALEGGQTDKAMEAMERALAKMRAMDDKGRDGKSLRGGRESERRTADRGRGRGGQSGGTGEDPDFGEGEGFLPGRGKSGAPKGDASHRLRGNPYDSGVEGQARPGTKEGMDTNMVGRGAHMPSRLAYLGVLGQYRKMMEEAIAREQVPRDFQTQVKEYFQSLDEK
jgi:hypothetical protein